MQNFECYAEKDISLGVLPFFHIYGMVVIQLLVLAQGATLVTMPKFDMEEFLGIVQKYKITWAPLVPPIVLGLAKHPAVAKYDLSSLRVIFCGAAPLGAAVAEEASKRVGCKIAQGYGMTEASPVTHLSPSKRPNFKMASSGWVVPNTEVMVVDPVTRKPCLNYKRELRPAFRSAVVQDSIPPNKQGVPPGELFSDFPSHGQAKPTFFESTRVSWVWVVPG